MSTSQHELDTTGSGNNTTLLSVTKTPLVSPRTSPTHVIHMLDSTSSQSATAGNSPAPKTPYTFDRMTRPTEYFSSYGSFTEFAGQAARPVMLPVYRILEAAQEVGALLVNILEAVESIAKLQWNDAATGYDSEDGPISREGLKNNLLNITHNIVGDFGYKDAKGTLSDSGIIRKLVAALASCIAETLAFITKGLTSVVVGGYKGVAYAGNSLFACCKPGNKASNVASAVAEQKDEEVINRSGGVTLAHGGSGNDNK